MPGAYYNEVDPFAVAWLRELIRAKVIADGIVDERSIEEVRPADVSGFAQWVRAVSLLRRHRCLVRRAARSWLG